MAKSKKVAKKAAKKPVKVMSQFLDHPYTLGMKIFIRTVTMIITGRLVGVFDKELVVEDAAWVADTGRFSVALKTGQLNEVEPFPNGRVIVGRGALVDACEWLHDLPRTMK